ncbi:MAG: Gfo/Idh/MocA family oxidoreductase [Planctomycetota bacterium]
MLETSRREFLQAAGVLAASSALLTSARAFAANDTINVACIGVGGRCRKLMESLRTIPGVKITTLCDVWDHPLGLAKPLAEENAKISKDWQEVLDDQEIDAVVIGTPDHWHAPLTLAACEAGKDVYVEKPLTHDLAEGAALLKAATDSKQIVQVGMQQRSMPHIIEARDLIQAGHIGRVVRVHLSWNRNQDRFKRNIPPLDFKSVEWEKFLGSAAEQPFDEYRMLNWRWFWDFGGGIFTDLMVHWIDVAHWILNVDHPEQAVSIGQHINAEGLWETPDAVQTLLTYPGNIQMHFEGMFSNARNGSRIEFQGTEASIHIDRGGYQVIPERKSKVPASELILGTGPRGADFYDKPDGELVHLTNWVDCIRTRKQPTAPIEAGVSAASAAHLANIAMREGGSAAWSDHINPPSNSRKI